MDTGSGKSARPAIQMPIRPYSSIGGDSTVATEPCVSIDPAGATFDGGEGTSKSGGSCSIEAAAGVTASLAASPVVVGLLT
jgi:hypothetical protein